MPRTSTRILLYNTGYCTGLDGSLRDYASHFLRYLYTPKRIWSRVMQSIDHIVALEQPDLCCFVEVRRVRAFVHRLWEYPFHHFESKYGLHSVLRKLPFFRRNSIGFFSRTEVTFRRHFFHKGMKKLLYEIRLNHEVSLIMSHLALSRRTRKKQLQELKELIKNRKHVILCGDFNVFAGMQELAELVRECGLKMVNSLHDATFPASCPEQALDLFLCSADLPIERLTVLHPEHVSDHLPVLLDVQI